MKKLNFLLLAGLLISVSACYYDNEEELYPSSGNCDLASVSFSTHIMPIAQGNCSTSGCHVAGGSGNGIFNNYAGLKAKADNGTLRQRVVVQKDMPPSHPITDCQRSQIEAWINAGAPNN